MGLQELCAACGSGFHHNCKPFECHLCASKTHRKCTGKRQLKVGELFQCVRCVSHDGLKTTPLIFPPGRAQIPSEDPRVRRDLTAATARVIPSLSPTAHFERSGQVSIDVEDDPSVSLSDEDSEESESLKSNSSGDDETPSHEVVVAKGSIFKSLVAGIKGNFLAFCIVIVVLLALFLIAICFFTVSGKIFTSSFVEPSKALLDTTARLSNPFQPSGILGTTASVPIDHFSEVPDSAYSTMQPIGARQTTSDPGRLLSLTDFICKQIPNSRQNYFCVNDVLQVCVIVLGPIPSIPIRIVPISSNHEFRSSCAGRSTFEISSP